MSDEEKEDFKNEVDIWNNHIENMTDKICEKLNIITFYTSGSDETRGWFINNNIFAPKAAGEIPKPLKNTASTPVFANFAIVFLKSLVPISYLS